MKKIIILLLVLCSSWSYSQEKWSIERCIYYALDNNIQLKQSSVDIEVSRLGKEQAKMAYIPSLNASVGYSTNWGRSLDPTTYSFINNQTVNNMNGGLSLGTTVFAGMQKLHDLRKAGLNWNAAIQSNEQLRNEITIAVAGSYLDVLYAKEQIVNSASQISSIQEQIIRTEKLVSAGAQPLGALLELKSQLSGEQYNLVAMQNQLDNSLVTLKQLLEIRDNNEFDIESPMIDTLSESMLVNLDQTYNLALGLPQIKVAELQRDVAIEDLSLAKARMYPTLSLGLNYGSSWSDARQKPQLGADGQPYYTKYPFFSQLGDNASTAMQLSLSVPIFNSLNSMRGIRVAKLNKQKAELGVTLAQNKLYKEIQKAYTDAKGALEKFRSAQITLTSTTESFNYADQKFSAGAVTSVDYTTAKNNLIIAQTQVTQAKYEYLFRVKILDFYGGIPITL